VENRSCADEADTGNDLRGNASVIAEVFHGQRVREDREQSRAETDKHIRAQTGRSMLEFTLQSNNSAQQRSQYQPSYGARHNAARHLSLQQFVDVLQVHDRLGGDPYDGRILSLQAWNSANIPLPA
jgi:hypothetical protein